MNCSQNDVRCFQLVHRLFQMFLDVSGVLRMLSFAQRCGQMISDVRICFQKITNVGCWIFFRSSLGVLLMFLGCSKDFPRIFSGCSNGSCEQGGSWGSGLVFWV